MIDLDMENQHEKEKKHVFIDSNVFLDFYRLGRDDLEKLNQLVDLINSGEIIVYLTKQVYEEFFRHREAIFQKTYKDFLDTKIELKMNSIFRNYPEYKKIVVLKKALNRLKSDLGQKVENDINNLNLIADNIIKKIFDVSLYINSDKYLEKAVTRHTLGNPPGKKNNSYGDEINWEALLEEVPSKEKLIIISNDGDYESPMLEKKMDFFLKEEWKKRKNTNIYLYKTLSDFFREHDIAIEFEIEEDKNKLIEALINSPTFASTHEIIRRLSKYNSFSEDQIKGLATALLGNHNVNWIIKDPDVKHFYKQILSDKSGVFDDESWSEIESYILVDKVEVNDEVNEIINSVDDTVPDIDINDIPF